MVPFAPELAGKRCDMRGLMWLVVMAGLACVPGGSVWAASASVPGTAPANAIETASGMRYVVLKPAPGPEQFAAPTFLNYRMTLRSADGRVYFDADKDGVQSRGFRSLSQEMPALARAMISAPLGETRRWWIEAAVLRPGYPGMSEQTQVIDLTVLGNYDPLKPPATVSGPPATAIRTASGLAYEVLKRGKGGAKPTVDSTIEIHYNGWTTDGKLFDSSIQRDQHAVFPMSQLIAGWQEGVQLMSPGDSFRFWIPGQLAYDNQPPQPGTPRGMLVFDVTLFSIQ